MPVIKFFAQAKEATNVSEANFHGETVAEVLDQALKRFGDSLNEVLQISSVWLNGNPTTLDSIVSSEDELAVIPPVSGG